MKRRNNRYTEREDVGGNDSEQMTAREYAAASKGTRTTRSHWYDPQIVAARKAEEDRINAILAAQAPAKA